MRILLVFLLVMGSPIWPIGRNPIQGDPFIIINKRTNELAFYHEGNLKLKTKVATGKTNELTPEGLFTVTIKAKDPYYRRGNIPGGDPRNPLGSRWIGFDARGTDGRIYGLHGTNRPSSIGKYISNGCVRLPKKAVEELYDMVPLGTKVYITNSKDSFNKIAKRFGAIP
ncbi:L,D-transpeptidase [Falsibacillus albus]|uniref:L,D-transpeptidase n=1 Tax=Falsibacillus albus TaxID=2478915 RepID=A0A3L7JKZ9_9BACI|nr:L,D-transpeptidase [Falsibacillus albus]RLQ91140.1 L,D-transpeptidase [Falsibacillus albus]